MATLRNLTLDLFQHVYPCRWLVAFYSVLEAHQKSDSQ